MTGRPLSRRRLLAGGAAAALGGACSGGGGESDGDLAFAARIAAVEQLAVDHYKGTATLLTGGGLGALVPQAFAALVAMVTGHHQQVLNAWNKVLADAGRAPVEGAGAKLTEALGMAAVRVTDIPASAALAMRLEDYACQTYHQAIPALVHPERVRLAAQAAIAGHQRQAVLRYLLGRDPVAPAGADPQLRRLTG